MRDLGPVSVLFQSGNIFVCLNFSLASRLRLCFAKNSPSFFNYESTNLRPEDALA